MLQVRLLVLNCSVLSLYLKVKLWKTKLPFLCFLSECWEFVSMMFPKFLNLLIACSRFLNMINDLFKFFFWLSLKIPTSLWIQLFCILKSCLFEQSTLMHLKFRLNEIYYKNSFDKVQMIMLVCFLIFDSFAL